MKTKILVIAMLCLMAGTLLGTAYADTSVNENQNYKLINQNNQKNLAVFSGQNAIDLNYDYKTGNGEVKLLAPNNLNTQQFYFVKAGKEDYFLMSRAGDTLYLVTALSTDGIEEGNKVVIRDAFIEDKSFQKWQLIDQGDGNYSVVSAADPSFAISFVGYENVVRMMPYTGNDTQQFKFEADQKFSDTRSASINRPVKLARINDDAGFASNTDNESDDKEAANSSIKQSASSPDRMNDWFKLMDEYAAAYRGIDFDGYYGAQCVDLAYHYTHYLFHPNESFGAFRKSINNGNGGEIYDTGNAEYYDKIKYYPGFVAQKGDLVVFQYNPARGWGHWGHVAVVESATPNQLNVITQNGSRGHYVRYSVYEYNTYAAYNYTEIVGFLRPKLDKIAH